MCEAAQCRRVHASQGREAITNERTARRLEPPFIDQPGYAWHRPEATLLDRIVEQCYSAEVLPRKPLRQWVLSLPFALRFLLAIDSRALTRVLGIVYRTIAAHILRKARLGYATGAVTLIQRFGSALNLNIHFHMLALDGACRAGTRPPVFRRSTPPIEAERQALLARPAGHIGRALERQGVLVRDTESSFLVLDPATGGAMDDLIGHWITYRVALGPRAGQKVFTLQTVPRGRRSPGEESPRTRDSHCTPAWVWKPISGRGWNGLPTT